MAAPRHYEAMTFLDWERTVAKTTEHLELAHHAMEQAIRYAARDPHLLQQRFARLTKCWIAATHARCAPHNKPFPDELKGRRRGPKPVDKPESKQTPAERFNEWANRTLSEYQSNQGETNAKSVIC